MLENLTTEQRNSNSTDIDQMSTLEIVQLMSGEDATVAAAVAAQAQPIAEVVDHIAIALKKGARLIYLGAGTSGRLGVLDASECPPTFRTDPSQVVGLIAGGYGALVRSIEGAEDFPETGEQDLREINLVAEDVVVGIATSGRTPYVLGGIQYARRLGCMTAGVSCNEKSPLTEIAQINIMPVVGPEVISGSTRLKAGTATKLVLNMLTTAAMVRIGKTYGNLMVDLRASNSKLVDRSHRIVKELTGASDDDVARLLKLADGEVKVAAVAGLLHIEPHEARQRLHDAGGHMRQALTDKPEPHAHPPTN